MPSAKERKGEKPGEPVVLLNGRDIRSIPAYEIRVAVENLHAEMANLKASLTGLNVIRSKLNLAHNVVTQLGAEPPQTPALLQLNESVFVDGFITDVSNFRLVLGAGYLVDLPKDACIKYYEMKMQNLVKQIDELAKKIAHTERVINAVSNFMKKNHEKAVSEKSK